jgi:hypothetical protein
LGLQGAWWIWATILTTDFRRNKPTYDWVDKGFGKGFALFLLWVAGFQLNYMYLYVNHSWLWIWKANEEIGILWLESWRGRMRRLFVLRGC